jgi:hypothetical protein
MNAEMLAKITTKIASHQTVTLVIAGTSGKFGIVTIEFNDIEQCWDMRIRTGKSNVGYYSTSLESAMTFFFNIITDSKCASYELMQ